MQQHTSLVVLSMYFYFKILLSCFFSEYPLLFYDKINQFMLFNKCKTEEEAENVNIL